MLVGVVASAAVLAAASLVAPAAVTAGSHAEVHVPARYASQQLAWKSCYPDPAKINELPQSEQVVARRLECAQMTAPRDWHNPDTGPDLHIAVSRLEPEHGTPTQSLFVNPGGPGGPGITIAQRLDIAKRQDVLSAMDIISFDPRGTGASTRVSCAGGPMKSADPRDRSSANLDRIAANNVALAARCMKQSAGLLPYISTEQTVRDVDLLRRLLGRQKINWLGYSAGTWMGAYYSAYFPDRVGRFVLDSNVDFTTSWQNLLAKVPHGFERRFRKDFAPWAAAHSGKLQLGDTAELVRQYYETLRADLNRAPVHSGSMVVDGPRLDSLVLENLYRVSDFPKLASLLGSLRHDANTKAAAFRTVSSTKPTVLGLAQQGIFPSVDYKMTDEQLTTFRAVLCNDTPWNQNRSYWEQRSLRLGHQYPIMGWWQVDNVCAYWHRPKINILVPTGHGIPPVLMVQSTHDPATPYEGALAAHRAFHGSRMVTVENEGDHVIYSRRKNACVDQIVDAFLLRGEIPVEDVTCQGDGIPAP